MEKNINALIFKPGDEVFYNGEENVIDEIEGNKAKIQNPDWENDEDDEQIPFWIWVELMHLKIR